jgi:DtxR family Mn-dependent transcriptional regulator
LSYFYSLYASRRYLIFTAGLKPKYVDLSILKLILSLLKIFNFTAGKFLRYPNIFLSLLEVQYFRPMQLTRAEENYIKLIHNLPANDCESVSTTRLASHLQTTPAAVTDMLQRLHQKGLAIYQKHQGVKIAPIGKEKALQLLRRQRLWEVFLVRKLQFPPDQAALVAEELEHIHSDILIAQLDAYLGHPFYSPQGKPIPDAAGRIQAAPTTNINQLPIGISATVISIQDETGLLAPYLAKKGIYVGTPIKVLEKLPFDESIELSMDGGIPLNLSAKVGDHIWIVPFKD